jgi:hypothetical protein
MSSTDGCITRAASSLMSTIPIPEASQITSSPCAGCWASALRRAFATSRKSDSISHWRAIAPGLQADLVATDGNPVEESPRSGEWFS